MRPSSRKPPPSSSTTPCGSVERSVQRIGLSGLTLFPDLTGALYAADYRALLVADLHFEKGSSRVGRGVHLPPYDTRSTLAALAQAVVRHRPERLISLGDSFHDSKGVERLDAEDRAAIGRLAQQTEIIWLTGNHDPHLSADLPGAVASELALGPITLRHLPGSETGCEIAGHLHPVAAVVRRGRRLSRKCFVTDGQRLVMPAFGAYTGGLNVLAAAYRPLFPGRFTAWLIGRSAVHAIPSASLRG